MPLSRSVHTYTLQCKGNLITAPPPPQSMLCKNVCKIVNVLLFMQATPSDVWTSLRICRAGRKDELCCKKLSVYSSGKDLKHRPVLVVREKQTVCWALRLLPFILLSAWCQDAMIWKVLFEERTDLSWNTQWNLKVLFVDPLFFAWKKLNFLIKGRFLNALEHGIFLP